MASKNRPVVQIALNTLYTTGAAGADVNFDSYFEVAGAQVFIYGSADKPTDPVNQMTNATPDGFIGFDSLGIIPNYIYVTLKAGTGTLTKCNLVGLNAEVAAL